jgi:hypothetical protein
MIIDELKKYFTREKLFRDTLIGFIMLCSGIAVVMLFFFLSSFPEKGGPIYFLVQNIGYFFMFVAIMMVYAAIHRENIAQGPSSIRSLLLASVRETHILAGILLATFLAILIVALFELLLSLIGYIPYAGPVISAILSLPLFVINVAIITVALLVWVVASPMVAEGTGLKQIPLDMLALIRKRGVIILVYTLTAVVALVVLFGPTIMIFRYAGHITGSVQWNIVPALPTLFSTFTRPTYITDIIGLIAPRTDPLAALQQYGSSIFNYLEMLGLFLKVMYGIGLAFLFSFVMALFFNILSICYTRVKKDVLK